MISITTPLHAPGNRFITEAYESLQRQTLTDWEWIVVENNGGVLPEAIKADPRVRVFTSDASTIGALKRFACERAEGEAVVELDNDDILTQGALMLVAKAIVAGADFVYSDFAEFQNETWGLPKGYPYSANFGWSHYEFEYQGHTLTAMHAPEATAHNIRLVDWAPNHVRAWRAKAYWAAGGHDATKAVGDDHDLIVRMFLAGAKFKHIPECLYLYRVHGANTVATKNALIRDATMGVYNWNIWKLAEKWTADAGLKRIDLCGGIDTPKGYTPIDRRIAPGKEGIECDLEGPWALEDSSVGILRAHDAVEHLRDAIHTMNEAYRVLAPGGWLMIHVPSTNGLGAFCDPTHRSFWNKLSFRYYTEAASARYVPEFKGRFQVSRIIEWFPSAWHKDNNVPYVEAHLFSMKDNFHAMGH